MIEPVIQQIIGITIQPIIQPPDGPLSNWILDDGTWDDTGIWIDSAIWMDAP